MRILSSLALLLGVSQALQPSPPVCAAEFSSRRAFLTASSTVTAAAFSHPESTAAADSSPSLQFSTTPSGLQWANAKIGSGATKSKGDLVAVDYAMATTGARYGSKIYSTADKNDPYRWKLGDGSTIQGLEEAILGGPGISPIMPGGIRRIIVPASLAYASLAKPLPSLQVEDCQSGKGVGPIPPTPQAFEEFQRFKNIYCNANRPYQPDLVMDIKLYGKRTR